MNSTEVIAEKYLTRYHLDFSGQLDFIYDDLLQKDNLLQLRSNTIAKNSKEFGYIQGSGGGSVGKLITDGLKLLYLSAEIISKEAVNIFNQNPLNILEELATEKYAGLQKKFNSDNYICEFGQDVNLEVWFSLLYKILDYKKRFYQLASELLNKGTIGDVTKTSKRLEEWSKVNENQLALFANHFNPILKKLNLEVDLVNTEYSISVKSKSDDEIVPVSRLSTGTKGLLLSLFPLYELNTTDSMILLDEPERSLFPDVQIDLLSHYQRLAPHAQFIVATHSPLSRLPLNPKRDSFYVLMKTGKWRFAGANLP